MSPGLDHEANHDFPDYDQGGEKRDQQDDNRGHSSQEFFNDVHAIPARGEGKETAVAG